MNHELIQCALTESIDSRINDYIAFINDVMNNAKFQNCALSLLPFDDVAHTNITFPTENITMGISLMRMDIVPDIFALGITLEVDCMPDCEKPFGTTIFITAAQTIDEICSYVKSSKFKNDVIDNFKNVIIEKLNLQMNERQKFK